MKFSVLVPCYSPIPDQLRHCLRSITSQLDLRQSEVIVLDDCTPDPAVCADVVAGFPGVRLHRTDRELFGCATTNLGFSLAVGEFLHVVHPDDWPLQGFYRAILQAANHVPGVSLYATNHLDCDEHGRPFDAPLTNWLRGARQFQPLHEGNPLAVSACVVRRSFYLEHGGWDESLIHTADWEWWVRATTLGSACQIAYPLACFRHHSASHTSRLKRDASNLADYLRMAEKVATYAEVDHTAFRAYVARRARRQAEEFAAKGDAEAAAMNEAFAKELEGA